MEADANLRNVRFDGALFCLSFDDSCFLELGAEIETASKSRLHLKN